MRGRLISRPWRTFRFRWPCRSAQIGVAGERFAFFAVYEYFDPRDLRINGVESGNDGGNGQLFCQHSGGVGVGETGTGVDDGGVLPKRKTSRKSEPELFVGLGEFCG